MNIPIGFCQCGCGQRTKKAAVSNTERGHIAGEYRKFVVGHKTPTPLSERFWLRVDKGDIDGCWLWTGKLNSYGYGMLSTTGRTEVRAHRLSYELNVGAIPKGNFVCHHCDNRLCVKPTHLFVGTAADNNHDARNKGRSHITPRGRPVTWDTGTAKITQAIADEIRRKHATGKHKQRALAKEYGLSEPSLSRIIHNQAWVK